MKTPDNLPIASPQPTAELHSRRKFVGGLATGLAAAVVAPAFAESKGAGESRNATTQAAKLAPAFVLLASPESSFVTGHIYDVQCGKAA